MKHSQSAAVLLAILPALGSAAPWFKRESPSVSISDNAISTTEMAASTTAESYATTSAYTSANAETTSALETTDAYGTTSVATDGTSAMTDSGVTSGSSLAHYYIARWLTSLSISDHRYCLCPSIRFGKYCHCMWCRCPAHPQGSSDDHHGQECCLGGTSSCPRYVDQ